MKDYYSILQVPHNAKDVLIKSNYKKLAFILHPDRQFGNTDQFIELNEAYRTLVNPDLRTSYDAELKEFYRKGFSEHGTPFRTRLRDGGNVNVLLDLTTDFIAVKDLAGGKAPNTIHKVLKIQKYSICPACSGEGKIPGTFSKTCPKCDGSGSQKNSFSGLDEACSACDGFGEIFIYKCETCNGLGRVRTEEEVPLDFKLEDLFRIYEHKGSKRDNALNPAAGNIIKFNGLGDVGVFGGVDGDLNVTVKIEEEPSQKEENAGNTFLKKLFSSKK